MLSTHQNGHSHPRRPLVAIVGATGTGKSQFAVDLARRHNGEVINGDAMQLYAGLPIITNKISYQEQQGIPHHLLGCIDIGEPTWTVGTFVKKALVVIEEIRARGKLPILVGGTHYYTQSLLFKDSLAEEEDDAAVASTVEDPEHTWPILASSNKVLYEELKRVDPVMAAQWHPNDRRKLQRSLMIYLQTGNRASDVYAMQRQDDGPIDQLRFDPLVFWVHTEKEVLAQRLNHRVDSMLHQGLLAEVAQLEDYAADQLSSGQTIDETRGIWVSIGYKEFKPYHQAHQNGVTGAVLEKLKEQAIRRTEIANRQYAKRQIRWIRIKLLTALSQAGLRDNLYLLDSSDAECFEQKVVEPAASICEAFLNGDERPAPQSVCSAAAELLTTSEGSTSSPAVRVVQHCDLCNVTCSTAAQWSAHTGSRSHQKLLRKSCRADTSAAEAPSHELG